MITVAVLAPNQVAGQTGQRLVFDGLPDLPDEIGVAGPLVGMHNGVVIVAGGANFARPNDPELWDVAKKFHQHIWVLEKTSGDQPWQWRTDVDTRLRHPIAYSAVVNTPHGVLCLGGEDENGPRLRMFLLQWDGRQVKEIETSAHLPVESTAGGAAIVDDWIYYVSGKNWDLRAGRLYPGGSVWRLPLAAIDPSTQLDQPARWEQIPGVAAREHAIVTAQHDGFGTRLYVIGGRRFESHADDGLIILPSDHSDLNDLKFLNDVWSFDPAQYDPQMYLSFNGRYTGPSPWRRETDAPRPLSAGTAVAMGTAHIVIPAYADGSRIQQRLASGLTAGQFDEQHPGFPKQALTYHTVTRTWSTDATLVNQVTTPAIRDGENILLFSGEIRPRVRTRQCWQISFAPTMNKIGRLDQAVVVVYLLLMLAVGGWFTLRNKSTDDYFRGGKKIPWFVAGCSIFATMLSSITYMAIPAKAFAQDWVYLVGNFMILAVAPIAIYVALPFFRHIDATSAYEYLEKRFNRLLRWIGSASFSLFHVFRIGIVLALAAQALSTIVPLTPAQCVVIMGVLSIVYCTLGGIEAVVWTDTVQTFVLLAGALVCLVIAWAGAEPGSFSQAAEAGKFHLANWDFGPMSFTTMAIWVVILGSFGQNVASYTADQAVVQRYMTTEDSRQAARSIWLNGFLAIPAGLLFFSLGTALWMFYSSRSGQLDPNMAPDAILPTFIAQQLPAGLAGLVVAGIFAAAQSTVSTSMNSGATTIVTDFLRVLRPAWSETGFLWLARITTLGMGVAGTAAGLLFVDPGIKSLFDEFVGILGLFLGVLAGLFALGATSRRANATGSLVGAVTAILVMTVVFLASRHQSLPGMDLRQWLDALPGPPLYLMSGYLYAFAGIVVCYVIGWIASVLTGGPKKSLQGLTFYDR